ncbi:MAG: CpaF family protein [Pirellulales bacterium]
MISLLRRNSPEARLPEVEFQVLKTDIHRELVESLDLAAVGVSESEWLKREVRELSEEGIARRKISDPQLRQRLLLELESEVFGLGPLEPLMDDPAISDILVNNAHEVYIERHGRLELTDVLFADDAHLLRIIQRIVARVGRRIDEVSPMVDARLPDGSRVNAVVPPLALDGPKLSIRRFGTEYLSIDNLLSNHSLSMPMAKFLLAAVHSRISFLISGGTGAGKTTMLNALSAAIPHDERIVTIEDSAELILQSRHIVRMETRPANSEGQGGVTQRDLVRNSLRMRPDRILVGEVRGAEALDMLQAMNTGHEGSLTTIHANDTRDALARLEMMVAMTGYEMPVRVVREYVASGIKLVIQLARLKGGARRVTKVSEILGVVNGEYQLEDVFGFKQQGLDEHGVAKGAWYATGYKPRCLARFADSGITLDESIFTP